jgi:hypothetical protein
MAWAHTSTLISRGLPEEPPDHPNVLSEEMAGTHLIVNTPENGGG